MNGKSTFPMPEKSQTKILVSSAVYGFEELLDQIYGILTSLGYEVWMSHKGTVPVYPENTALESCRQAVRDCDLFLGIILPRYGSGAETKGGDTITHEELREAIRLKKPRWILAHDHVVFARQFLRNLGYKTEKQRAELNRTLKTNEVLEDLRVIDMLELAMRHDVTLVKNRKGNWVQKFIDAEEANLFAFAQFRRFREAGKIVEEQFGKPLNEEGRPK